EGLCSGAMLLTNSLRENGQDELFQEGFHLATYVDEDELIDKAQYYLATRGTSPTDRDSGPGSGSAESHLPTSHGISSEDRFPNASGRRDCSRPPASEGGVLFRILPTRCSGADSRHGGTGAGHWMWCREAGPIDSSPTVGD